MSKAIEQTDVERRSFLIRITTGLIGAAFLASFWPYLRSLHPNILYEPPRKFKIGMPDKFQQGATFLEKERLYIFRDGNAYHTVSAVCTHLGCTVKFSPFKQGEDMEVRNLKYKSIGEFHCPCHGSKFRDEGTNYAGPAPRPLAWHPLEISPADGQIVVDVSKEVDRDFRLVV